MPPIRRHEDIIAWQLCEELADLVIQITSEGRVARDLDFCDQIRRSSGAPGPHIAEGFGRYLPRAFANYLRMAISSLMETDTWLRRGERNGYWKGDTYKRAKSLCDRALDMTRRLLASKLRQIAEEDRRKAIRKTQRSNAGSRERFSR